MGLDQGRIASNSPHCQVYLGVIVFYKNLFGPFLAVPGSSYLFFKPLFVIVLCIIQPYISLFKPLLNLEKKRTNIRKHMPLASFFLLPYVVIPSDFVATMIYDHKFTTLQCCHLACIITSPSPSSSPISRRTTTTLVNH